MTTTIPRWRASWRCKGLNGDSVANHTGQPINKRYLQMRRPEIYLLRDIDGDLKATVTENKAVLR